MRRLLALFFVSGSTGLVYETVWGRDLHLIFGTSQFAVATVLAAFMTGLALGGWLGARLAPRVTRPLRAYAALEALIGVFALAFPWVLEALQPAYLAFWRATEPGPLLFGAFQFLLVGLALLVPTACMGATLPILVRFVGDDQPGAVGTLYGVNTAGAVFGTWLVGFWLLPAMGVRDTTVAAALANLGLAALALTLDRSATPLPAPARAEDRDADLLLIALVAGFSSLALEVAWFRLLSLILGASAYAFTVMLLAFLAGIAAGGHLGGRLVARARGKALLRVLAATQLAVALLVWGAMWLWPTLPVLFVQAYWVLDPEPSTLWVMKCGIAMLVMSPAAVGMGATFPLLAHAAARGDLSRPVGRVYAANTVGSLLGAFVGGFVLLPALQVRGTALLCVTLNLSAALVAWLRSGGRPRLPALGAALVAAGLLWSFPPPWNPMMMTSGVYKYVDNLKEPTAEELRRAMIDRYELLWYREGLSTVVTVARNRVTGNQWLANNGKIDASTSTDMPTQVLVAHTPMLFLEGRARRSMLIGLASGITLGAMTLHPELETIDVVELEPSMPEAARLFAPWNHDALADPRVRLIGNDARNQLVLTPPGTYDLVVAEPSNPWLTGVANLFTREFFVMGQGRLAPGGIWAQWVQMYGMDARDLQSVIRTFCEVYPHVLLFSTIRDADLVMLGSNEPITMSAELADRLVKKNVGVESELAAVGVIDAYDLLSHYLFDRAAALNLTGGIPLNTDDNLLVEYSAPKNLHRETSGENFLMLLPHAQTPLASVPDADGLVRLAESYAWRDDYVRALIALKEAEAREPGRPDTLRLWEDYQGRLKRRIR